MGKYQDFQNRHSLVATAGASAVTQVSAALDTKGMEQVTVILSTGVIVATGTINVKIEDSPDNSVWSDLAGAAFAEQSTGDDDLVFSGKIKCNQVSTPVQRYLRISGTAAVALAEYGVVMLGSNLSGNYPLVTNAIPTPVFDIGNP
jgi:hypothetical protein